MSSDYRCYLLGKHFTRVINISHDFSKVYPQTKLFRYKSNFSDWFLSAINPPQSNSIITVIDSVDEEILSDRLSKLSQLLGHSVDYNSYDFSEFTCSQAGKLSVSKYNLDNKVFGNFPKNLNKEVLIDSFYSFPILGDNSANKEFNNILNNKILKKIKVDADIVIITGEMIWSDWLSFPNAWNSLNFKKNKSLLVIFDSFGAIQQMLLDVSVPIESIVNDFAQKFENSTVSIAIKTHLDKEILNKKPLYSNIYINIKQTIFEINNQQHTPDFLSLRSKQKILKKGHARYIPIGLKISDVVEQPKSIIGKFEFKIELPSDTIIQKPLQESVSINEDIGLVPHFNEKYIKFKHTKLIELFVSNGQYIKHGEIIGERKILKKYLKEKILSPIEGYIDTSFIERGIIKYKLKRDVEPLISDFEGEILDVQKTDTSKVMTISSRAIQVGLNFKHGDDVHGKLSLLKELNQDSTKKILLIKNSQINQINPELLIKSNAKGIILPSTNYNDYRNLKSKVKALGKDFNVSLIGPLSINYMNHVSEIFFLYLNKTCYIKGNTANLFISANESREIYTRLQSKSSGSFGNNLKKGQTVGIFDYSHQEPYARIEKFDNNSVVLSIREKLLNTGIDNLFQYSEIFTNAKKINQ